MGSEPALVRRNVRFNTVLLNTTSEDSMKKIAKPGLGQGFRVHHKDIEKK